MRGRAGSLDAEALDALQLCVGPLPIDGGDRGALNDERATMCKYEAYVRDLGHEIAMLYSDAVRAVDRAPRQDKDINEGVLVGIRELVGIMRTQADALGIPAEEHGLGEIDPL